MRHVVIGARGSALSLRQTEMVRAQLQARFPDVSFEVRAISAKADEHPDVPLAALGGEGVFVKELEARLIRGEIDLAVHSLKDLPLELPQGLAIAAVTKREDPRDALVSRAGCGFEGLPSGARVGTSSLRRRSQLLFLRRDLEFAEIRGNVDTRLRKLAQGRYDAIVLAACGLIRLGLEERISECLPVEQLLPEPGQGALALEARQDDAELSAMLTALDDEPARLCVQAERAFLGGLGGGCRVPIAAYGEMLGSQIRLTGAVIAPDGSRRLRESMTGSADAPEDLGRQLAQQLRDQGADRLLASLGVPPVS